MSFRETIPNNEEQTKKRKIPLFSVRKPHNEQDSKRQKQDFTQQYNEEQTKKRKIPLFSVRKPQNEQDSKRQKQDFTQQKQPSHYNVIICCHGNVVEPRPGLKSKQKYNIHKELTDINFLVSYGESLGVGPGRQDVNTLYQCDVKGICDFSSSASILMRLVCDSKASNIIKKIPTNVSEITLSEMVFSFDINSIVPDTTEWFHQLFGIWICTPELNPIRILTHENFDKTILYNWQDMFNNIGSVFNQASSSGIIPNNTEVTYSLFMLCCRANTQPTPVILTYSPNPKISIDMRGGDDSLINKTPTPNQIEKMTNDIKEKELDDLKNKGFVQLTEEQFDLYLSPENPTINEVIDSLNNTEVKELIEEKEREKTGGRKTKRNKKQKPKRNKKQKTNRKLKRRKISRKSRRKYR